MPIWNVHVAGQIIRTTDEHPFWVLGRGWVPTKDLHIGDFVTTRDGLLVPIEGVADSGQVETVYNWRVADHHTYFVSVAHPRVSIWVQNAKKAYEADAPKNAQRRPKFRKATLEKALDKAPSKKVNGVKTKVCPTCEKPIGGSIARGKRTIRDWAGDHEGQTWAQRVKKMPHNISRKKVVERYQERVRALCAECNESHRYE